VLGEEARKVLCGSGGAVGEALVVTVIGLVGASHCGTCQLAFTQPRFASSDFGGGGGALGEAPSWLISQQQRRQTTTRHGMPPCMQGQALGKLTVERAWG